MSYQELVAIVPWTLVAQICNLLLQAYLFKRFLLKPVQNIIRQRQEQVDSDLNTAQTAREEAEAVRRDYEQHMLSAHEEAAALVRNATQTAQNRSEQMIQEAKEKAAALHARAEQEIDNERKKAAGELKNDISNLALSLAGKVVEKEIDPAAHKELIDEFIDRVGDAS